MPAKPALIRALAPTAAALLIFSMVGPGGRSATAAAPLTAKAPLPTVLLYPATPGDVAALVDLRTRLRLDGRVEVLTYDPESAAIQRASAEDAHPEWLISAPTTDEGRMFLARALGVSFYAVVSPGRATDSTHVELVETAPAARTFDWTGSNRQFGVRAVESQVADSIAHPASGVPPAPAVVAAAPAPAVVAAAPAPAVVAAAPAPAVVAAAPAPAVVAAAPAPAVVAAAPAPAVVAAAPAPAVVAAAPAPAVVAAAPAPAVVAAAPAPAVVAAAPAPAVVAAAPAPAVVAAAPAPAVVAAAPAPAVVAAAPAPIVIALPKPLPPVKPVPVPLIPVPAKPLAAILPPGVVPFVPIPPALPVTADVPLRVVLAVPVSPLLPSAKMTAGPAPNPASVIVPSAPVVIPPSKGTQMAALPKPALPVPLLPQPIPAIAPPAQPTPAPLIDVRKSVPKAEDMTAIQPLLARGDAALAGGDAVSAIALYRQAINGAPLSIVPRLKLAQAYQKDGLNDRALDEARRALEIAPDNGPVQQFLSDLDQQTGTSSGTLIRDRAALEHAPNSPIAHAALADALWNNGDLSGAEAEYKSAQALAPAGDHAADAHLAQLYAAEARYDDCLAALSTAGTGGYALATQIVKNRAETLSSTLSASRDTFTAGKSTREQFYDDAKKLSAEAQALAAFVAQVKPPARYKLSHLHRMLATNLLAQEAATLVTFIETSDARQNDSISQLERAAATEMLTAQATEEKLGLSKEQKD